jgi:surfactin family lipopeptide synthetase A
LLSKVNEAFNTEINDILLTALGLAVRQTYGHEKVLIALEGHGREDILADVDISRTVGWFTSVYPLLLDVSMAEDLSRQIKEVKESLHKIPSKGVGYGILKYLTAPENKQGFTFDLKPQISFNYLGQFDSDMNRDSLKMAAESQGRGIDQEMGIDYDLVVTGILARKTLNLSVQYSNKQFKAETISLLTDNLHEQLKKIIAYCVSREEKEITPSDLTYDGLSIDTMESLSAMFDD